MEAMSPEMLHLILASAAVSALCFFFGWINGYKHREKEYEAEMND
jgi:hypothetical protein